MVILLAMAGVDIEDRRRLADAVATAVRVRPPVAGRQLVDVGIDGGPWVGEALKKTRDAMVDGKITEDEALEYALACARRIQRGCRS